MYNKSNGSKDKATIILFFFILLLPLLLSGCGRENQVLNEDNLRDKNKAATSLGSLSYNVPNVCASKQLLLFIGQTVEGAEVLPSNFNPTASSELGRIIGEGGKVCVIGVQELGIGVQITYLANAEESFLNNVPGWLEMGFESQPLDTLTHQNIVSSYYIKNEASEVSELHSMKAEVLFNGVWVSVSSTYTYNKKEMSKLVDRVLGEILVSFPISPRVSMVLPHSLYERVRVENLMGVQSEDPQTIALLANGAEEIYVINVRKLEQEYFSNLATLVLVRSNLYNQSATPVETFGKMILDSMGWVIALEGPYEDNFDKDEMEVFMIAELILNSNTYNLKN